MRFLDGQLTKEVHEVSLYSKIPRQRKPGSVNVRHERAHSGASQLSVQHTRESDEREKRPERYRTHQRSRTRLSRTRHGFESCSFRGQLRTRLRHYRRHLRAAGDSTFGNQCHDTRYAKTAKGFFSRLSFFWHWVNQSRFHRMHFLRRSPLPIRTVP